MKKIAILRHGRRPSRDANTRENAAAIGQKLIQLGRMLQDPEQSTLVPSHYFNRIDERNAAFVAFMHGDNGVCFEVCFLVEQITEEDDFDVTISALEPR